jgi:hypothetical protein
MWITRSFYVKYYARETSLPNRHPLLDVNKRVPADMVMLSVLFEEAEEAMAILRDMCKETKKKKGGGCALYKPQKHKKCGKFEWKSKDLRDLEDFEKIKMETESA